MTDVSKTVEVDKLGLFTCPCDDDGAIRNPGDTCFRLGKYTFTPCLRCCRQIEGEIMGRVVMNGAKLAIEANIKRQELAGGEPLGFLKNAKVERQ